MPGKRQHYVPLFLLRRFAADPTDRRSLIVRLDKRSGRPSKVNPRNEAVQSHYYRMEFDDGTTDNTADEFLDRVETDAATAIRELVDEGAEPSPERLHALALFVVTLKQRTPEGREQVREADLRAAELHAEMMISDTDRVREVLAEDGLDEDEIQFRQREWLADLQEGRLVFESSPSREVALMFSVLEKGLEVLLREMTWTLVRAPEGCSFVLSDHPVAHFDPTPKMPGAGASFLSSPNSQTLVPLDARAALVLEPARSVGWSEISGSETEINRLNLLTYAQAKGAIYGPSQFVVTDVRARAKADKPAVALFERRPPRLWVTELGPGDRPGEGGVRTFESVYQGHKLIRSLFVPARAEREGRKRAWPQPLDD